jgi:hypothetical protein
MMLSSAGGQHGPTSDVHARHTVLPTLLGFFDEARPSSTHRTRFGALGDLFDLDVRVKRKVTISERT